MSEDFTYGIEEEFFLADSRTRNTLSRLPQPFLERCKRDSPIDVTSEMLQSQLELVTPVLADGAAARAALGGGRAAVARAAAEHGILPVAASTHPLALWREQVHTDSARYTGMMDDLKMLGNRNLVCGMHVHVRVPDLERRVELMRRLTPFLPLFLALSASSPFWQGHRTGLMAYRLAAYDELPRTGLPPMLGDTAEWEAYVALLQKAGVIKDASYLWFAVRPSLQHPTLELRISDCCTRLDDALAVAALYRCLMRLLYRDRRINDALTPLHHAVAQENKWRAQRYGTDGTYVDVARGTLPFADQLEELLDLVAQDARDLGHEAEMEHVRRIPAQGTSAHGQIGVYRTARLAGDSRTAALRKVVDWLAETTTSA